LEQHENQERQCWLQLWLRSDLALAILVCKAVVTEGYVASVDASKEKPFTVQ